MNTKPKTIESAANFLGYLFDRWQDEQEYEDFAEYRDAMKRALPDGATFERMEADPFEVAFTFEGKRHTLLAGEKTVTHKEQSI